MPARLLASSFSINMILLIVKFIVGLLLIIKGADWLTDGASDIARRFNVSSLVIGLTIVAFGTSAPELVVSVISAVKGQADLAIGNVVGSNIFNSLAIVGVTAIICPVACSKGNIRYDVPLSLLASVVLFVMANDTLLGASSDVISRSDGIVLLCFMAIFMAYSITLGINSSHDVVDKEQPAAPLGKSVLLFLVGLAGLIVGGEWMVDGASGIAAHMGVSQSIIALTIVAAGTSFPEMMTSIMAARKGDTDMALGNVVGSNIFNIFFILGTSATITPLQRGDIGMIDFITLVFGAALIWVFCRFGRKYHHITRLEGVVLAVCAVIYYIQAVIGA